MNASSFRLRPFLFSLSLGFAGLGLASMAGAQSPPNAATAPPSNEQLSTTPIGIRETTLDYDLTYQYPSGASAWPGLVAWFYADIQKWRVDLTRGAHSERSRALRDGVAPHLPYSLEQEWSVAANTPGWLSLRGWSSSYMGGANPAHGATSLLWDKVRGQAREPVSLFISEAALNQAVQPALCAQLGLPPAASIPSTATNPSTPCPAVKSGTVILHSSQRRAFDQLNFFFNGYLFGARGAGRDVTLPVTPAVLAAVRPEFRSAFALSR